MVDVEISEKDIVSILKWFGLAFEAKKKVAVTLTDKKLYKKLTIMREALEEEKDLFEE